MRNSLVRSLARLRSIARKAAGESKIVLPAAVVTNQGPTLSAIVSGSARNYGSSPYTSLALAFPALVSAAYLASDYASAAEIERTFIAIKPDGVQRGLISEIIARFERKGYKLVGLKLLAPTKEFAEKHYSDLSTKPFFNGLTDFLSSGPVVAMVWEGPGVVKYGRKMIGATNPLASEPGTIRGDYAIAIGRNVIHGSDSVETAVNEIALWFESKELVDYHLDAHKWVYES